MENMRFKVGDKVRIKSLDWYNANKTEEGCLVCGSSHINPEMICMLGKTVTISSVEGLAEEETASEKILEARDKHYWDMLGGESKNEITLPQDYQFVDENGNIINATKIVLEKKKKYPKTYEECCKIIEDCADCSLKCFACGLLNTLQKLLVCRDAYWKIAGEEMGLGKPWEPDWDNLSINHEFIKINKGCFTYSSRVFVFPTEEMRDVFYENFKEFINECKELL